MGEDLLYSRFSPRGKGYYIARFPGGKATMGEKLLYNTGSFFQYTQLIHLQYLYIF
jgi:hypothetical protein